MHSLPIHIKAISRYLSKIESIGNSAFPNALSHVRHALVECLSNAIDCLLYTCQAKISIKLIYISLLCHKQPIHVLSFHTPKNF